MVLKARVLSIWLYKISQRLSLNGRARLPRGSDCWAAVLILHSPELCFTDNGMPGVGIVVGAVFEYTRKPSRGVTEHVPRRVASQNQSNPLENQRALVQL